jgi:MSHA biogenesis protein MshN
LSVINQMLQELDRRNAVGAAGADTGAQAVKPVASTRRGHEWFWRILAVLVLISVTWVGWVAYQLQPRPLVTPLALKAAEQAVIRPVAAEKPAPVVEVPEPRPAEGKPEPVEAKPVEAKLVEPKLVEPTPGPAKPAEMFKLARSIETPIVQPTPRPAKAEAKKPVAQAAPAPVRAPASTKVVVDKRDHSKAGNDAAEARFRRAAALLNQARVSEAEEQLAAALQADPSHVPARQAYVALLLEQQRVGSALRLLREAVDANPAQPTFSLGLARVYAEQRDYPAALAVIEKAGAAGHGADFQVLRAAVLQRLGRHAEAVTAYQSALTKSAQPAGTWTGLGISLEALGRNGEAAQAYKHALGAGALPSELREYSETRLRALQ